MTSSVQSTHTNDFISVKYETLAAIQESLTQDPLIHKLAKLIFPSGFDHTNANTEDLLQIPCSFLRNNAAALVCKKIGHRLMLAYLIRQEEQELSHYLIHNLGQEYLLLNLKNGSGETALHTTIKYNAYETAQVLLQNNANVNISCDDQSTPLHYAIEWGVPSFIKLLLSYNAESCTQNAIGYTPEITAKLFKNSMPIPSPKGPFKELYHRVTIATIFGIRGESHYRGHNTNLSAISLEGCYSSYFHNLLSKVISTERVSNYPCQGNIHELSKLFQHAIHVNKTKPEEILNKLNSGEAVMIPSGFIGHAIMLLIYPEYTEGDLSHFRIAIANRGSLSKKPIEFWTMKSGNLTEYLIQDILDLKELTREEYKDTLKPSLWPELECYQTNKDTFLESQCTLEDQLSSNCSWISTITVIWAFLALKNEGQSHLKEKTDAYYDHLVSKATNHMVSKYINKHTNGSLRDCQIDKRILNHIYKFYIQEGNSHMENLCKDLLQVKSHFPSRTRTNARNRSYTYQPY